jgi:hypothetical protein
VEHFKHRRQTELKHWRISLLAVRGYITPEISGKLPGFWSSSACLHGFARACIRKRAWGADLSAVGSARNFKRRRQTELTHGRFNLLAAMGYITPDHWQASWLLVPICEFYTTLPLEGIQNELVVQAPVSFWDPAGLVINTRLAETLIFVVRRL